MTVMRSWLAARPTRGASDFATFRTRSNVAVEIAPGADVKVTAESNDAGTSTLGVLRPSLRAYVTRYRVKVTELADVGAVTAGSFIDTDTVTRPGSPKIVGTRVSTPLTVRCT